MKNKIIVILTALAFTGALAGLAHGKFTCEVEKVEGNKLVLKKR